MIEWDEFYPNMYEVQLSSKYFTDSLKEYYNDIQSGDMSLETAMSIAASAVWAEARRYQDNKTRAALTAERALP